MALQSGTLLTQSHIFSFTDLAVLLDKVRTGDVRSISGYANNLVDLSINRSITPASQAFLNNPALADGSAYDEFVRISNVNNYPGAGNLSATAFPGLPNERNISDVLGAQAQDIPEAGAWNHLFMGMGQYIDHGLDFFNKGANGTYTANDGSLTPNPNGTIGSTRANPLNSAFGTYFNTTTAWVDQNQLYGSDTPVTWLLTQTALNADGSVQRDPVTNQLVKTAYILGGSGKFSANRVGNSATGAPVDLATGYDILINNGVAKATLDAFVDNAANIADSALIQGWVAQVTAYSRWLNAGGTGTAPAITGTFAPGAGPNGNFTLPPAEVNAAIGRLQAAWAPVQAAPGYVNLTAFLPGSQQQLIGDMGFGAGIDPLNLLQHYVAGDLRTNENAQLSSIHAMFAQSHNHFVDSVRTSLVALDGQYTTATNLNNIPPGLRSMFVLGADNTAQLNVTEAEVFQMARMAVNGYYQRMVYDQYLTALTGGIPFGNPVGQEFAQQPQFFEPLPAGLQEHGLNGFHPETTPSISLEFNTAGFRVGHTQISANLDYQTLTGGLFSYDELAANAAAVAGVTATQARPLIDAFLSPGVVGQMGGVGAILSGNAQAPAQAVDTLVHNSVRNLLVGRANDLFSANVMRGREVGLPTLQQFRRQTSTMLAQTGIANALASGASDVSTGLAMFNIDPATGLPALGADGLATQFDALAQRLAVYTSWEDFGRNMRGGAAANLVVDANGVVTGVAAGSLLEGFMRLYAPELFTNTLLDADGLDRIGVAGSMVANAWTTNTGLDRVELWIGMLAEAPVVTPNGPALVPSLLGSTGTFIIQEQFDRLQDADIHYYKQDLMGTDLFNQIASATFTAQIQSALPDLTAQIIHQDTFRRFQIDNLNTTDTAFTPNTTAVFAAQEVIAATGSLLTSPLFDQQVLTAIVTPLNANPNTTLLALIPNPVFAASVAAAGPNGPAAQALLAELALENPAAVDALEAGIRQALLTSALTTFRFDFDQTFSLFQGGFDTGTAGARTLTINTNYGTFRYTATLGSRVRSLINPGTDDISNIFNAAINAGAGTFTPNALAQAQLGLTANTDVPIAGLASTIGSFTSTRVNVDILPLGGTPDGLSVTFTPGPGISQPNVPALSPVGLVTLSSATTMGTMVANVPLANQGSIPDVPNAVASFLATAQTNIGSVQTFILAGGDVVTLAGLTANLDPALAPLLLLTAQLAVVGLRFDNKLQLANALNNTLAGSQGDDDMRGGDGADIMDGDLGIDHIFGQGGNDLLSPGVADGGLNHLYGGKDNDVVLGGALAETLQFGEEGTDLLILSEGALGGFGFGGADRDFLLGGAAGNVMNTDGDGQLVDADDVALGGVGGDEMIGRGGGDLLMGGDHDAPGNVLGADLGAIILPAADTLYGDHESVHNAEILSRVLDQTGPDTWVVNAVRMVELFGATPLRLDIGTSMQISEVNPLTGELFTAGQKAAIQAFLLTTRVNGTATDPSLRGPQVVMNWVPWAPSGNDLLITGTALGNTRVVAAIAEARAVIAGLAPEAQAAATAALDAWIAAQPVDSVGAGLAPAVPLVELVFALDGTIFGGPLFDEAGNPVVGPFFDGTAPAAGFDAVTNAQGFQEIDAVLLANDPTLFDVGVILFDAAGGQYEIVDNGPTTFQIQPLDAAGAAVGAPLGPLNLPAELFLENPTDPTIVPPPVAQALPLAVTVQLRRALADRVFAGAGADEVITDAFNDTEIFGGEGIDKINYTAMGAVNLMVEINPTQAAGAQAGVDGVVMHANTALDRFYSIEQLDFAAGSIVEVSQGARQLDGALIAAAEGGGNANANNAITATVDNGLVHVGGLALNGASAVVLSDATTDRVRFTAPVATVGTTAIGPGSISFANPATVNAAAQPNGAGISVTVNGRTTAYHNTEVFEFMNGSVTDVRLVVPTGYSARLNRNGRTLTMRSTTNADPLGLVGKTFTFGTSVRLFVDPPVGAQSATAVLNTQNTPVANTVLPTLNGGITAAGTRSGNVWTIGLSSASRVVSGSIGGTAVRTLQLLDGDAVVAQVTTTNRGAFSTTLTNAQIAQIGQGVQQLRVIDVTPLTNNVVVENSQVSQPFQVTVRTTTSVASTREALVGDPIAVDTYVFSATSSRGQTTFDQITNFGEGDFVRVAGRLIDLENTRNAGNAPNFARVNNTIGAIAPNAAVLFTMTGQQGVFLGVNTDGRAGFDLINDTLIQIQGVTSVNQLQNLAGSLPVPV